MSGAGGTLYVVATPIGNLADVTLRALEVLRAVPLVAAEDTRLTRRLFARHGIAARLISYHARNAALREPELLEHLAGGADLALVTDAGTPLVSDPGEGLVAAWAALAGMVIPIPGPSAVLAALVASGIAAPRWGFEGFLPRGGRARRDRLARIAADDRATVLFEAARRAAATLADLAAACGVGRPAALCRELTKIYEETWRGTLGDLAARAAREAPRGEVTIVVGGAPAGDVRRLGRGVAGSSSTVVPDGPAGVPDNGGSEARLRAARDRVGRLVADGLPRSAAARQVAAETGLPRRELFRVRENRAGR
jgi:16S rRNA (cytidine1402-2'-O)-methyltransferase